MNNQGKGWKMAQKTWVIMIVFLIFIALSGYRVMAENEIFPATGGLLPIDEPVRMDFQSMPAEWRYPRIGTGRMCVEQTG
jgi:hypothetical protein